MGPHNKDYSILGSISGSPILGNYHVSLRFGQLPCISLDQNSEFPPQSWVVIVTVLVVLILIVIVVVAAAVVVLFVVAESLVPFVAYLTLNPI